MSNESVSTMPRQPHYFIHVGDNNLAHEYPRIIDATLSTYHTHTTRMIEQCISLEEMYDVIKESCDPLPRTADKQVLLLNLYEGYGDVTYELVSIETVERIALDMVDDDEYECDEYVDHKQLVPNTMPFIRECVENCIDLNRQITVVWLGLTIMDVAIVEVVKY